MDRIATGSLINVFEFVPMDDIMTLHNISRYYRETLNESSRSHWENMRDDHLFSNKLKLVCNNSIGTTALLIKASNKTCRCVQCLNYLSKPHEFYGVRLCKACTNLELFVQRGLKSVCQEFFLDSNEQINNPNILKRKHGNAFMVLQHQVMNQASKHFTEGVLQKKLNDRKNRRLTVSYNRTEAVRRRMRNVKHEFDYLSRRKSARIDASLGGGDNLERIYGLLLGNSLYELVCGDIFNHKVDTYRRVGTVADHLIDFVCMLTYMKKLHLLNDSYSEFGEESLVKYIFKKHQRGLHFYENVSEYALAIKEYEARVKEVQTFIDCNDLDASTRKALAVAMCAEDDVEFSESDFIFFIENGEGNPAEISRLLRQKSFLHQNDLMVHVSTNLQLGYGYWEAMRNAKNRVLNRTLGYPPMRYVCRINFQLQNVSRRCGNESLRPSTYVGPYDT